MVYTDATTGYQGYIIHKRMRSGILHLELKGENLNEYYFGNF